MSDTAPAREPASAPPPGVAPASTPESPGLTTVVVVVVTVAALYWAREVLIPITLALLLSFVLSPLVNLLRRAWLGRVPSVIVAVILALGIILAFGSVIGTQVAQLANDLPQYQTTVEKKIHNLREATVSKLSDHLKKLSRQFAAEPGAPAAPASGPGTQARPGQQGNPVVVTQEESPSVLQIGEKIVSPLLNPLATAGIILVVTIFALLQKEDIRDRGIRLFGSHDLHRTTVAMNDAGRRLSRYFLTQLGINTVFGAIVGTGLYFIGVPNPVLWGMLGTLLRFIPYIGSWIAAALPILLAAAVESGWSLVIWTALLYVVTELTMGQIVEPLVYGHSTGLSPLAVIVSAIFWTWLWGPIGLIISTPLTLCLVVLGRHVEHLEFFDVLLGDRPPLTPVESLYQRMLAGDPDEAEDQAERFLAGHRLSTYYDEVVLKALQLAANDIALGTLEPWRVERLKRAITELVQEMGRYDDVEPANGTDKTVAGPRADGQALPQEDPPIGDAPDKSQLAPEWRGETPVLCVAGRGSLDEAASTMLAQLLEKHGLGARVVPHEVVSRLNIEALDVQGVAMMCICYLDISGQPAHLRYLLRRLRQRQPKAALLVGLWPEQDPILKDRDLGRTVGADYYVSTLREGVEACLKAAQQPTEPRSRLLTAVGEAGCG